MKVVHFLPHFPGREGTTAYCRGLCAALYEVVPGVVEIWSFKEQGGEGVYQGVPVLAFPGARRHAFCLPKAMRDELRHRQDEISGVVLHGTFNPPMATMGRLLKKLGIPYIFIPHDPYADELMRHGRFKKWVYWQIFEKGLLARSAGVLLLAEAHRETLRERGYDGEMRVIPNGCDPEVPYFPRVAKGADEPRVIQYLGRMDRNHKGLDLLIEGFGQFLGSVGRGKVLLVLSGNDWLDRAELEQKVVELGLEGQVIFTGARAESSAEVFSKADLAVLTSRFDGFGLTVVEAMLAGCPVLVTETCGVASHVQEGDAGWVVKAEVGAIARGFEEAWAEREQWEERGGRAREFVRRELTWEKAARESLKVYHECFEKKEEESLL